MKMAKPLAFKCAGLGVCLTALELKEAHHEAYEAAQEMHELTDPTAELELLVSFVDEFKQCVFDGEAP